MTCYRPQTATKSSETGQIKIGRATSGAWDAFFVPCGICMGCRLDHARSWAIRCVHEAATWDSSYFITLTYSDENLPAYGSLAKSDLQRFMKRLRKAVPGDLPRPDKPWRRPVRFFACGEYGEETGRAHYHALLFNLRFPDLVPSSATTFRSEILARLWPAGHHEIGALTPESAAYVAGYSVKKVRRRMWNQDEVDRRYGVVDMETGELHVRDREFTLCSRKPGVGRFWLDRYAGDLKHGYVPHDGKDCAVPRYYRRHLAESQPDLAELVSYKAWQRVKDLDPEEKTPERLEVKEEVAVRSFYHFNRGGAL